VLERSIALAHSLGRTESLVNGLVGLWTSRIVQGRTASAHKVAERVLTLVDDEETGAAAHFARAGSAQVLGRSADAVQHFATAASLSCGMLMSVGTRTDVHGLAWAAHAHWLCGDEAAAETSARQAIALARSLDHPYSVAVALAYAAITHQLRGDLPELRRTVAELRALCARYGFGYYREWGLVLDGWCRGGAEGVDLVREGIANLEAEGALVRRPYWQTLLADLLDRLGDRDGARTALDAAVADAHTRHDLWWLPEVLRLRAAHDAPADAVARLRTAADLAAGQGSVGLLRRCERDLTALAPFARPPERANAARTLRS
jgi:hypothetical protein